MQTVTSKPAAPAGWSIPAFCASCNFSRASFYNIPDKLKPRSVKLGKRHIIIEAPSDYLARLPSSISLRSQGDVEQAAAA